MAEESPKKVEEKAGGGTPGVKSRGVGNAIANLFTMAGGLGGRSTNKRTDMEIWDKPYEIFRGFKGMATSENLKKNSSSFKGALKARQEPATKNFCGSKGMVTAENP